jgi:hypothetical protein
MRFILVEVENGVADDLIHDLQHNWPGIDTVRECKGDAITKFVELAEEAPFK